MLVFILAVPISAFAQDSASVVILKLERFDASDDLVDAVQRALERGIEAHGEMTVKDGGEMSIKEFALTAGCEEVNDECMKTLRDFVDADRVVFGSVQQSDDVSLFTLKMYDFAESRFVSEVTDQTVQGDISQIREVLPAVVENFLYGDVGILTVNVVGADGPELFFDGEKVGLAPTTLENLPLGEHVVSLKTADGEEQTEKVVLRAESPTTLEFQFGDAVTDPGGGGSEEPVASSGGGSKVPGIVAIGVGVVGIGVGAFGAAQVSRANADYDALIANEAFVDPDSNLFVDGQQDAARDAGLHPEDIDRRGKTFQTIEFIGFGVGAAGVITGVILLATSGGGESDTGSAKLPVDIQVAPTRGGIAASLGFRF